MYVCMSVCEFLHMSAVAAVIEVIWSLGAGILGSFGCWFRELNSGPQENHP